MPAPQPELEDEESRLLKILAGCNERVNVCREALLHPTRILLLPEYAKLPADLEIARVEFAKSTVALRAYRKSRRGPQQ